MWDGTQAAVISLAVPIILVVDINAHTRSLLTAMLRRFGYDVRAVATGAEALVNVASASAAPADAVVAVVRQADPTLVGLCAFLRKEWQLPLVAVTAFAEGESASTRIEADAIVSKPFDPYQLGRLLREVLERATLPRPPRPIRGPDRRAD
jgi:CheY-like chemotaxis protein